jgi:4-amino-4-deoxychorismate lyase
VHVRRGEPWLLDAHLDRMERSAGHLALDLPPRAALAGLAAVACAAWPATTEGALRLVCTRGPESGGPPSVYATLTAIGERQLRGRRAGIAVRTLSLGFPIDARSTPGPGSASARADATGEPGSARAGVTSALANPLLAGAKTLSYAVNMACLRWAAAEGADDVLWVSGDGYALEGPTSTLVWLTGGVLCTVPPSSTGILAGTTAAYLLAHAAELGWTAEERLVRSAELYGADGVWLTSSGRGPAEIRMLDGVPLGPSAETARVAKLLGFPSVSG